MKMSLNKSIKGILFFSIVLLFSGCKHKEIKFGAAYNKKRTEVGLQEIPKQWGILKAEKDFAIFINPDLEKKPLYYSKTIRYKDNKWTDEEDIFYSGKKFETIDGHLNESLHVTYYFVPTIKGFDTLKGLQIIYTGPTHSHILHDA
jgi:hypothetical protein